MSESKEPVKAEAQLIDGRWVVEKCPHCGKRHFHGAGAGEVDPRRMLGHRNLHCHPGGYVLVETRSL